MSKGERSPLAELAANLKAQGWSNDGPDMVNRGGLRVFTTIDLEYQDLAQRTAAGSSRSPARNRYRNPDRS